MSRNVPHPHLAQARLRAEQAEKAAKEALKAEKVAAKAPKPINPAPALEKDPEYTPKQKELLAALEKLPDQDLMEIAEERLDAVDPSWARKDILKAILAKETR